MRPSSAGPTRNRLCDELSVGQWLPARLRVTTYGGKARDRGAFQGFDCLEKLEITRRSSPAGVAVMAGANLDTALRGLGLLAAAGFV